MKRKKQINMHAIPTANPSRNMKHKIEIKMKRQKQIARENPMKSTCDDGLLYHPIYQRKGLEKRWERRGREAELKRWVGGSAVGCVGEERRIDVQSRGSLAS
jgi:hypothetical protein